MKKVIKPSIKEESVYYSDFSGKCFGEWDPPVILKLEFGYGSKYDGSALEFHLSDEDVPLIIETLKNNVSADYKNELKKKLKESDVRYEDHVQSRDWDGCEYISNSMDLIKELLNK